MRKDRPSIISRHVSYMEPAIAAIRDASWPPTGLPVEGIRPGARWFKRQKKPPLYWPGIPEPGGSVSPRSTTATISDSQDTMSSLTTDDCSSGPYSHYSGYNSTVYARLPHDSITSQVHALLDATCTSLIWDVRQEPKLLHTSDSASRFYGPNTLSFPLTSTGAGHVRIMSPDCPWTIELGPKSRAITASEALHALYELFSKDLDDTAWTLADESLKATIERARKRRTDTEERLKNVDWLGKRYMFKGFYRDENYTRQRLQPGATLIPETFLVTFARARNDP
ncbi:hypothetical protein M0805_009429 [Coniferiporia weirii]|nr:hypothetical protein M0805_009429 [Coniferiporia weirii]